MNPPALYEQTTVREWFLRDRRGAIRQYDSEQAARAEMADNPHVVAVLYRDVTTGPLTEAEEAR